MENKTVGCGVLDAPQKYHLKKVISVFLSIVMLFSIIAGIDLSAYAAEVDVLTEHAAAEQIRDHMKAHDEEFTLIVQLPNAASSSWCRELFNYAISDELATTIDTGDYLRKSWYSMGCSWGYASQSAFAIATEPYVYFVAYEIEYRLTADEENQVTSKVNSIIKDLNLSNKSDYEKVKAIHDYMCKNITYDYDNYYNGTVPKKSFTAYGALIDGVCVCDGYSLAFYRLCIEAGLEVRFISSSAINHSWNIVKVDGKWYNIDVTWDDQEWGIYYKYFLRCSNDFEDHDEGNAEYTSHKFTTNYPISTTCYENVSCSGTPASPIEHDYSIIIVTMPTCTEKGYTTYTCECGDSYVSDYTNATGHTVVTDKAVAATCTTAGKTAGSHCSVCNTVITAQKTVAATGHTAVTDKAVAATCTTAGKTEGSHCSVCNTVIVAQNTVPATGHSYGNGKVTTAANCTTDGVKTYTCTKCKATKTETIKATGHTDVKDAAVAATCTETGKTAGSHCSVCNEIITAQETVPATGHSYDNGKVTKKATCKATGTKTYTCTECGETKTETIVKTGHTYKTTATTKATTKKNGSVVKKCTVCGAATKTTIYSPKTITLSAASYIYDGKVKKPSVTVKDSKGKKIASSNYTVKYASNKNVGKATVTITFKGNYSGTVKKTFTIKPKATTLSSVTAASKGFTVKWKKQATQTTGYEIQYSTDKNFKKNNKTVTVSKNSTTSKSVSKLSAKKKYYIRVRTYKTVKVNGKSTKIYSSWSSSKAVTTKGTATSTSTVNKTGDIVYITPTGKKYHYSKACAGKNAIKTTLSKAKKTYGPCSKCS